MKLRNPFKKVDPAKEIGKQAGKIVGGIVGGAVSGVVTGLFGEENEEQKSDRLERNRLRRIERQEQERVQAIKDSRQSWLFRFFVLIECVILFQFIVSTGIDNASFGLLFEKRSIVMVLPLLGWIVGSLFINKTKL